MKKKIINPTLALIVLLLTVDFISKLLVLNFCNYRFNYSLFLSIKITQTSIFHIFTLYTTLSST